MTMEPQKRTIRTIVAEDEELILQNLVKKIQAVDPAFQVIGTALDGATAIRMLEDATADLLITEDRKSVV